MKTDQFAACQKTGFVFGHASACEQVASRVNAIILFREPGVLAGGLIAENYSMKGFRIDTKSCNWGPMAGFVCVDPRLTKASAYHIKNAGWTAEALSGHIVEKFFGKVEDPDWKADVMPIVISRRRVEELTRSGIISPRVSGMGELTGQASDSEGTTTLLYRLVPTRNGRARWLKDAADHYVVCIDKNVPRPFAQRYPQGVEPIRFGDGHVAVLGMINPGTKERGFKACVTADYDLFAIWPGAGKNDMMGAQHRLMAQINKAGAALPGGVARMGDIDTRLQKGGHREHHRFGDVSARVMHIKTMLNSALQGGAGYSGGNAIHHNDEAGNFALAKGTLLDCLPLIGFLPTGSTVLIEDLKDFKELVLWARDKGYQEVAKPEWLAAAGVH